MCVDEGVGQNVGYLELRGLVYMLFKACATK